MTETAALDRYLKHLRDGLKSIHAQPPVDIAGRVIQEMFIHVLTQLRALEAEGQDMNAKIQQIVDDLAANRVAVRAVTNIALAIKSKLQSNSAVIAQLRADLAAAILALSNAGLPAADLQGLQDVHDGLVAVTAETDTDVAGIVADLVANTEVPPTA